MPRSPASIVGQGIAKVIDDVLIRHFGREKMGYVLMLHPLGMEGKASYHSNINKRDAIRVLKEVDKQLRLSLRSGGNNGSH